ncbi:MAG TPA: LamG domain-containing protein [Candidatus Paceibacterota bacterium]|nr:LamG domain-containing protein [Candidatus Paceibacterota bacterium]
MRGLLKSGVFLGALIFFLPLSASASVHIATPANQLGVTAYWSFDSSTVSGSSVSDLSGNSHTLTLVNGASITSGYSGQALSLNGSSQYAWGLIGTLPTSVSLSMWVKANDVATEQSILTEEGDSAPGSGYHFTLVGIYNGAFYAGFWDIGDIASGPINAGQWYNVVLYYDGVANTQSLYVDGVLQGTQSGTWSPPSNIYFLAGYQQSGCSFTSASGHCGDTAHYFNGQIDDLKGYNRALTQSDISSLQSQRANIGHSSSGASVSLSKGLVGYWPLDGATTNWTTDKTSDVSGQGNTATMVNMSTTTAPVAGKIGQALSFNGSSNYITPGTALAATFQNSSFSVSTWVMFRDTSNSDEALVSIGSSATDQQFHMLRRNDKMFMGFFFDDLTGSQTIAANRWYHITETWDASTKRQAIYVNGVLDASRTSSGSLNVPTGSTLYIAKYGSTFLPASLDDVRIYNRALSASEVGQLYQSGQANVAHSPTGTTAGALSSRLVGYWTFDGSKTNWRANTTQDSSGQGNTGTLINLGTTTAPVAGKIGQAFAFGAGSYVFPNASDVAAPCTVSAWVKPQDNASTDHGYPLIDNGGTFSVRIQQYGSSYTGETEYGVSDDLFSPSYAAPANAWTFLTFVNDTGTATLYANGVAQGTISGTYACPRRSIGGNEGSDYFSGLLDDVRVYNRALSAVEVAQLYQMSN